MVTLIVAVTAATLSGFALGYWARGAQAHGCGTEQQSGTAATTASRIGSPYIPTR